MTDKEIARILMSVIFYWISCMAGIEKSYSWLHSQFKSEPQGIIYQNSSCKWMNFPPSLFSALALDFCWVILALFSLFIGHARVQICFFLAIMPAVLWEWEILLNLSTQILSALEISRIVLALKYRGYSTPLDRNLPLHHRFLLLPTHSFPLSNICAPFCHTNLIVWVYFHVNVCDAPNTASCLFY